MPFCRLGPVGLERARRRLDGLVEHQRLPRRRAKGATAGHVRSGSLEEVKVPMALKMGRPPEQRVAPGSVAQSVSLLLIVEKLMEA
jgi:hypothetical protein